jgi:hypothetical protein
MIGDEGEGVVIRASSEYEVLAKPKLGELCQSTPAFHDGRIYVRGEEHLFCIGQGEPRLAGTGRWNRPR